MHADHYLPVDHYRALIEALATVKPDPGTGEIEPHCFIEALGEIGGIWPASMLDDPLVAGVEIDAQQCGYLVLPAQSAM